MPTLRPLTEVARADAKFFADTLVPALAAVGWAGTIALIVTDDPEACVGDVLDADVIVEGTQADVEALLAGKQRTQRSALDKLKAEKRGARDGALVRGTASSLRSLIAALAPKDPKATGAKDIAAEAGAVPKAKARDRVRTADGRYIKGVVRGAARGASGASPSAAPAKASALVGGQRGAATDRASFALANLAAFIGAGLEDVTSGGALADEDKLVLAAGEVRRG